MPSRRNLVLAAAACAIPLRPTRAASFPTRDITFVVPWGAGGANDILARELQPLLREQGVNIVIENQVGATGAIGLRRVASAVPDGYTLGMGTSSTMTYMAQGKTPLRNIDFTPIARISTDPLLLLMPGNSPILSLKQFVTSSKARPSAPSPCAPSPSAPSPSALSPGALSIGTPGTFNLQHIMAAMAARAADTAFIDVPFTGGAQVVTALAGQQIDAGVLKPSESIGQIRSGLVRPIGVFANRRLDLLPDVPTFKEHGFDVFPYGPVVQMAYAVGPARLPAHGVECVPHAWGSAVGLAATIHFLASLPDQPPCLFPVPPMLEFEQEENPFRDHLAKDPITQRNGIVAVPGGPGLGIEVDRAVIGRYRA